MGKVVLLLESHSAKILDRRSSEAGIYGDHTACFNIFAYSHSFGVETLTPPEACNASH